MSFSLSGFLKSAFNQGVGNRKPFSREGLLNAGKSLIPFNSNQSLLSQYEHYQRQQGLDNLAEQEREATAQQSRTDNAIAGINAEFGRDTNTQDPNLGFASQFAQNNIASRDNAYREAFTEMYQPQLLDQFRAQSLAANSGLAARGATGGSADYVTNQQLSQGLGSSLQDLASQREQGVQQLHSQDDQTRLNLINSIQNGLSPNDQSVQGAIDARQTYSDAAGMAPLNNLGLGLSQVANLATQNYQAQGAGYTGTPGLRLFNSSTDAGGSYT